MTALEFDYQLEKASKSLKPFAMRLTKDLEDANDLIQETLYKAFTNKDKFSDGTNLKAWLYTIMKNTFITNYQRMVRRKTFIDTTENLHFINSTSTIAENAAASSFAMQEIGNALENLEEVYRMPFMMYYKGFKYHEIAERLAIPIGTVKNRIHIARKELKDKLLKLGYQDKTI
ncbi:MAG: RNA polymerase sigma factor [Raineya sp.]